MFKDLMLVAIELCALSELKEGEKSMKYCTYISQKKDVTAQRQFPMLSLYSDSLQYLKRIT